LPPGRYVSRPLWLKDNVELRLEAGATVVLSPDKADWPAGARALVNSQGAKHIAITGQGTFDGKAQCPGRGHGQRRAVRERDLRDESTSLELVGERGSDEMLVLRDVSNLILQDFHGEAARPAGPLPAILKQNGTERP